MRNGVKVPLLASALGWAVLAAWPDHRIVEAVHRIERIHRALDARVAAVLGKVAAVRRAGHASGSVAEAAGQWSLAMVLPGAAAPVDLVLGLSATAKRIRPHGAQLADVMRRCVADWRAPAPAAIGGTRAA